MHATKPEAIQAVIAEIEDLLDRFKELRHEEYLAGNYVPKDQDDYDQSDYDYAFEARDALPGWLEKLKAAIAPPEPEPRFAVGDIVEASIGTAKNSTLRTLHGRVLEFPVSRFRRGTA